MSRFIARNARTALIALCWVSFFMWLLVGFRAHAQQVAAKPASEGTPSAALAPPIPADLELAFAQADRDVAQAKLALKEYESKRDKAAQDLMEACPAPFGLSMDPKTGRFACVSRETKVKEPPKK